MYVLLITQFYGNWEGWDPVNRFNHASWLAVAAPTYRPKSARNRCAIEVLVGFCVVTLLFGFFSCRCKVFFGHKTESVLFLSFHI